MVNRTPRRPRLAGSAGRRRLALIGVTAIVAATAAACGSSATPEDEASASTAPVSSPELGEIGSVPAGTPDDALVIEGVDPVTGETVKLSDFAGKPIVLNFWASWCPPCREELPALMELARTHPEIQVVGINLEDAASDARALQEEIGFDWPSIADPDKEIARQLGLIGMPTTYFLDADHRITGQIVGGTDLAGFEEGLGLTAGDGP